MKNTTYFFTLCLYCLDQFRGSSVPRVIQEKLGQDSHACLEDPFVMLVVSSFHFFIMLCRVSGTSSTQLSRHDPRRTCQLRIKSSEEGRGHTNYYAFFPGYVTKRERMTFRVKGIPNLSNVTRPATYSRAAAVLVELTVPFVRTTARSCGSLVGARLDFNLLSRADCNSHFSSESFLPFFSVIPITNEYVKAS